MPRTIHMQDHQGWGNAIHWSDWPKLNVHGHLAKLPEVGDFLTCDFQSGARHKFKFTEVKPCLDPRDMFFGTVEYVEQLK